MKENTSTLPIVAFHRVHLKYESGPCVLRNVQFSLEKGSFHFITGESGAGKTTLLSLMYLDNLPTSGSIQMFGRDLGRLKRSAMPPLRRRIGVVFQDFRLLDYLTAYENVALPLKLAGMREADIKKHVSEMLNWVGLGKCANAYPETLSGGEKQRVAIARAVINRPQLLLADEPTGNVDDAMASRIMHLLLELNRLGTTVVIATHNEDLIRQINKPRLHLTNGALDLVPSYAPATPIFEEEVDNADF